MSDKPTPAIPMAIRPAEDGSGTESGPWAMNDKLSAYPSFWAPSIPCSVRRKSIIRVWAGINPSALRASNPVKFMRSMFETGPMVELFKIFAPSVKMAVSTALSRWSRKPPRYPLSVNETVPVSISAAAFETSRN